jgi:predicted tellurium resistance membrane protein TerC
MATKAMRWQLTKTARQGFWIGGGFTFAGLLAFVGVLIITGDAWQLALLGAYLLATGIAYLASAVALQRRQRPGAGCDGKPEARP